MEIEASKVNKSVLGFRHPCYKKWDCEAANRGNYLEQKIFCPEMVVMRPQDNLVLVPRTETGIEAFKVNKSALGFRHRG